MRGDPRTPQGGWPRRLKTGLPGWLLLGLGIRFLLIPFHHPWDLQTWYNMFVDLAHNHSPYETLRYLTFSTRAQWNLVPMDGDKYFPVSQAIFYEYYAYPPLPLVLYYPLAKLYALLAPLDYQFVVQGALAVHRVPVLLLACFKAPIFIADAGIAVLLWRLAGEQRARSFYLNPLVILVSAAWMIEDLMVVFAILAVYLAVKRRYGAAGFALALGTLAKWTPGILWPAIGLWLVHQRVDWRRQVAYHGVFLAALAAGTAPFWDGVRLAVQFHALRPGANLSPHALLYVLAQFHRGDMAWYYHIFSPYVGALTLPLALGAAYLVQMRRPLPLPTAACLTIAAFLLGSKVVNEPYVCLLLPMVLWEDAERPSGAKVFVYKAAYALPLAYTVLNVPVFMFGLPAYLQLARWDPWLAYRMARAWPRDVHAIILATLAFAFVGLLLYAWHLLTQEARDEAVPDPARRPDLNRSGFELPPHPVG